jgi:hypothetical protein
MRITLLGVLFVLGAGALLWYVFQQIELHNSQSQSVKFDEQHKLNETHGPNGNQTIL